MLRWIKRAPRLSVLPDCIPTETRTEGRCGRVAKGVHPGVLAKSAQLIEKRRDELTVSAKERSKSAEAKGNKGVKRNREVEGTSPWRDLPRVRKSGVGNFEWRAGKNVKG